MFLRIALVFLLVAVAYVANAFANPIPERIKGKFSTSSNNNVKYGVSYSFEQAGWYGLDPKQAYLRLLDEFDFAWIRLPFFWNQMISENGELRIESLEFAIQEADRRNVKIIIALGAKTPYFPEYHWPEEIEKQVEFGQVITLDHPVADEILETAVKVVEALADYENITYWQVENEPLIGNVNRWKIDPQLVAAEVDVVRGADPQKRPVILNHAAVGFYDHSWQQLLPILKPGDVFAVNAFFKTKGADLFNAKLYGREIHIVWPDHLVWPVQSWGLASPNLGTIKKKVEENGNRLWILEAQAEPYIKKLEEAVDPVLSFEPDDIVAADQFLRSYRIESVGLWGAHFWQYREKLGDRAWIDVVEKIVNSE